MTAISGTARPPVAASGVGASCVQLTAWNIATEPDEAAAPSAFRRSSGTLEGIPTMAAAGDRLTDQTARPPQALVAPGGNE